MNYVYDLLICSFIYISSHHFNPYEYFICDMHGGSLAGNNILIRVLHSDSIDKEMKERVFLTLTFRTYYPVNIKAMQEYVIKSSENIQWMWLFTIRERHPIIGNLITLLQYNRSDHRKIAKNILANTEKDILTRNILLLLSLYNINSRDNDYLETFAFDKEYKKASRTLVTLINCLATDHFTRVLILYWKYYSICYYDNDKRLLNIILDSTYNTIDDERIFALLSSMSEESVDYLLFRQAQRRLKSNNRLIRIYSNKITQKYIIKYCMITFGTVGVRC